MDIPDCYDPVYQAEQLEAEADKHAVHCYCCDEAISGDVYIVDGENICEDCLLDVIKSNYTAKEIAKAFGIPVGRPWEI